VRQRHGWPSWSLRVIQCPHRLLWSDFLSSPPCGFLIEPSSRPEETLCHPHVHSAHSATAQTSWISLICCIRRASITSDVTRARAGGPCPKAQTGQPRAACLATWMSHRTTTRPFSRGRPTRYTSPGFLAMIVGGACRSAFRRVHTRPHWSQRT